MYRRICKECGIAYDTEDEYQWICDYCAGERKKRQAWHRDVQRRRVRKPDEKPREPWVVNKQDCGGCKYFFEHGLESTCDYFLVTGQIKQPLGAPTKDCKYREKGPKARIPGTYEQYSELLKKKRVEKAAKTEEPVEAPEKAEMPKETKPKGRPKKPQKEEKPKRKKMSAEEKARKGREKAARRYARMKAEHRCSRCGAKLPEEQKTFLCAVCAEGRKEYQRKEEVRERMRAAARMSEKKRYEKRSAERLCIRCGIQLAEGQSGKLCAECAVKAHEYQKKSRENRKCRK